MAALLRARGKPRLALWSASDRIVGKERIGVTDQQQGERALRIHLGVGQQAEPFEFFELSTGDLRLTLSFDGSEMLFVGQVGHLGSQDPYR